MSMAMVLGQHPPPQNKERELNAVLESLLESAGMNEVGQMQEMMQAEEQQAG